MINAPPYPSSTHQVLSLSLPSTQDPLVEAARIVSLMTRHAAKIVESHVMAYDVARKRQKPLLALQALIRGTRLRKNHPDVFYRVVDFFNAIEKKEMELHPTVQQVIR